MGQRKKTFHLSFNLALLLPLLSAFLLVSKAQAKFCGSLFENLKAPLCTDAKHVFWVGSLITAGVYLEEDLGRRTLRRTAKNRPLGEFAPLADKLGRGFLNLGYIVANFVYGTVTGHKYAYQWSELMFEATLYSAGVTYLIKSGIDSQRPGFREELDAFPSGHAAISFSFATVVALNHGFWWGTLAMTTAALISYGRLNDEKHHLHDVLAGTTIGLSYALGIYLNHEDRGKPYWLAITPSQYDIKAPQLTFLWKF